METPENKQAAQVLALVMRGSSIEEAMERVIGPGDWSDQAAQLEQAIEEALKSTYARVEDWHWEKAKFDGSNCGIGSGGFQPGNTCGAADGAGGQKPKAKRGRKKAATPATPATKREKKRSATKARKQPDAPKTPRKPKSPPKPRHLAQARKAIASLSNSIRKMGQKTLKGLLDRIKRVPRSIGKRIETVKSRREQKQQRNALRSKAIAATSALRKAAQDAHAPLMQLYELAHKGSELETIANQVWNAGHAITTASEITRGSSIDEADLRLGGNARKQMLNSLSSENIKRIGEKLAMSGISKKATRDIVASLKRFQSEAKNAESIVSRWNRVESRRFSMNKIEDQFYRRGTKSKFDNNCGTGAGGFKPGNKCGQEDAKSGGKDAKSKKKPSAAQKRKDAGKSKEARKSRGKQIKNAYKELQVALLKVPDAISGYLPADDAISDAVESMAALSMAISEKRPREERKKAFRDFAKTRAALQPLVGQIAKKTAAMKQKEASIPESDTENKRKARARLLMLRDAGRQIRVGIQELSKVEDLSDLFSRAREV